LFTIIPRLITSSSTSSHTSLDGNHSKPKSYSQCTNDCANDKEKCGLQGTSSAICEGGENMCLKDCCVMFQSSDPMAAAWCSR
jgi:hypothetical protein